MFLRDIHQELQSYYNGVIALYNGKLWILDEINMPEPTDGSYDEGDVHWDYDAPDMEVSTSMQYFSAICREMIRDASYGRARGDSMEISMDDLLFSFPQVGLVNVPVIYQGYNVTFNTAKYITRTGERQWRRALRYESLSAVNINSRTKPMIEMVTGEPHDELSTRVTNNSLYSLYFPEYSTLEYAMTELQEGIGTYALSSEWWVGQGQHGIIFGNQQGACGKVDEETGRFKFESDNILFLKESLIELIGEQKYEA